MADETNKTDDHNAADGANFWGTGNQPFLEGLQATQEFWKTGMANWGKLAEQWWNQAATTDNTETVREELQAASQAVAQAWMRLPLLLSGQAKPEELQHAFTQLMQAQGHAQQLWFQAMQKFGTTVPTQETAQKEEPSE